VFEVIIQAYSESLTAGSSVVTLEASGILLEGVSFGSVTGSVGVDADGRAGTTLVTNSLDDSTMASHKSGGSEQSNDRRLEKHPAGRYY
jgi:hypothetical protein